MLIKVIYWMLTPGKHTYCIYITDCIGFVVYYIDPHYLTLLHCNAIYMARPIYRAVAIGNVMATT